MLRPVLHQKLTQATLTAILSAPIIYCQNPQPRFEAATVRAGGELFSTQPQRSAGRFTWTTQLNYLIGYAYGLDRSHILGKEIGAIYAVNAVFEPNATENETRLMLQSLLAERFNLRFHREVKEVDGYAISIGKGGNKMKESAIGDQPASAVRDRYLSATLSTGATTITGRRATLAQLCETLGRSLGATIWDQTGLKGEYDFSFRYAQDLGADSQTDAPSIATALRESLGLILQKQRGPLETLVIDHLEEPSEN